MYHQIMLMIFTIILSVSCNFIPPKPSFQIIEICPPVFQEYDLSNSIYKVYCRCAPYDISSGEFLDDFKPSNIKKCDRAYGIVTEDFLEKFEPDVAELEQWYSDIKGIERAVNKYIKKKRKKNKN